MESRLLIIGGTGFIGLNLAREAFLRGFLVTIISVNEVPKLDQNNDFEYLKIDIRNKLDLKKSISNRVFHYVINLGGYINHDNYFDTGSEVIDVHLLGTKNIIDVLNKNQLKTFIQIGSSDEYGSNPSPQVENQREIPLSPYSFAKAAMTNFFEMLHHSESFPVVIIRLFLVYGPGQKNDRFLPQVIKGCLQNNAFKVSKGEQIRDFCYIDDIVEGILSALDNNKAYGEIINLASGRPISISRVINQVRSMIGSGKPEYGSIPYRAGENMELYANIKKAEKLLGWKAKTQIKEGLEATLNFYKGENSL